MADDVSEPELDENDESAPAGEKPMGFLDHLEELRVTLVKCAATLVVALTLIGVFLYKFKAWLEWPWQNALRSYPDLKLELRTNTPMEVYGVIVQICVVGSIVMALPVLLIWISQFIAPALTAKEKRVLIPSAIAAFFLFLGGATFAFFLLTPAAVKYAIDANLYMGYAIEWTADSYYSLVSWLTIGVGLVFEFPLLIIAVTYIGVIDVATLRKSRRIVFLVCVIAGALITPTTDMVTMMLVALPMYVLFEIALVVASVLIRKKLENAPIEVE